MKRHYSPKHLKKGISSLHWLYAAVAILLLVAVALFTTTGSPLARYITTTSGGDSARVARFAVTTTGTLTETIPMVTMKPGDTNSYTVKVKNESEVSIACRIEVDNTYNNLPLSFKMLKDGTQITEDTIPVGDTVERTYTLCITWHADNSDHQYAEKVDLLVIRLIAEQVD